MSVQGSKKCAVRTFAFVVWESTVHLTSSVNILSADNITNVIVLWERRVFWFQNFNVCVAVFGDIDDLSERVKIITQDCSRVMYVK